MEIKIEAKKSNTSTISAQIKLKQFYEVVSDTITKLVDELGYKKYKNELEYVRNVMIINENEQKRLNLFDYLQKFPISAFEDKEADIFHIENLTSSLIIKLKQNINIFTRLNDDLAKKIKFHVDNLNKLPFSVAINSIIEKLIFYKYLISFSLFDANFDNWVKDQNDQLRNTIIGFNQAFTGKLKELNANITEFKAACLGTDNLRSVRDAPLVKRETLPLTKFLTSNRILGIWLYEHLDQLREANRKFLKDRLNDVMIEIEKYTNFYGPKNIIGSNSTLFAPSKIKLVVEKPSNLQSAIISEPPKAVITKPAKQKISKSDEERFNETIDDIYVGLSRRLTKIKGNDDLNKGDQILSNTIMVYLLTQFPQKSFDANEMSLNELENLAEELKQQLEISIAQLEGVTSAEPDIEMFK